MIIAYVPLALAIIGALIFGFSANPKTAELGKLTFFAGMLAFAFAMSGHTWHLP
jgi:hypothetical protein